VLTLYNAIDASEESGLNRAEAELLDDDLSLHDELGKTYETSDCILAFRLTNRIGDVPGTAIQ